MRGEKNLEDNVVLLKDWEWVNEHYELDIDQSEKITKIEINPSGKMADVDKKNNIIKFLKNYLLRKFLTISSTSS